MCLFCVCKGLENGHELAKIVVHRNGPGSAQECVGGKDARQYDKHPES